MDDLDQIAHGTQELIDQRETPPSAAGRLRAFEDEIFGRKEPRIEGQIQKGYGSKHRDLPVEAKMHHAALEGAVEAEKNLADARAKLVEAEAAVATAESRVAVSHDAHEKAKAEPQDED